MSLIDEMNEAEFSSFLMEEISQEKMLTLDFSYFATAIDAWWKNQKQSDDFFKLKAELLCFFLNKLNEEDIRLFKSVGLASSKIAAVCIKNTFKNDSPKLALIIHEALSELFHLTDVHYDYEEHKTLYLKNSAVEYKNWGGGYGEITPHSDDLYEYLNVDYLSLTTCRDKTCTPTKCFFPKDILKTFSNNELFRLKYVKANFTSGKNVSALIQRTRNILDYSEKYGFRFFLDFRVDNITGKRMTACNTEDQFLLDRMRKMLDDCPYESSFSETGTFLFVANYKVLHARAQMNIEKNCAVEFSRTPNLTETPRLLYRSKGPRREYLAI